MAQGFYSIDLADTEYPMLSEQQSRTVIGTNSDRERTAETKIGVAYCHNVMPSRYGIDAVGYFDAVGAASGLPAGESFLDVRIIYSSNKTRKYIAWDSLGNAYILDEASAAWQALPATSPVTGGVGFSANSVAIGTVNGVSYIFYSGTAAFIFDEDSISLAHTPLTGLQIEDIVGITSSSGYLVAYTEQALAWSSTIDPTDFVPSQVTGAGGGNVSDIAGPIVFCTSNTLGVLIYTEANIVAGTFTGNLRYPFKFREVDDSKGGIDLDRVAYEANSSTQYVFSKAGLQAVTSQRAQAIFPEATDFLAGRVLETYNEATRELERFELTGSETMLKKIKYVASRYLIISYGLPSTGFTHALVFDTALTKAGKIKVDHVDVFEYTAEQSEISKESIAVVLADGSIKLLDFSTSPQANGVLMLGKLQYTRTRLMTLLGVEVENAPIGFPLSLYSKTALDGKTTVNVEGSQLYTADGLVEYGFRATAKNHTLVLEGAFNVVSLIVRYTIAGRR